MKYNTLAINEIIGTINAINTNNDFMAQTSTCVAVVGDKDMGLRSKSDYRKMYSAKRSSDDWNHFAEAHGLSNLSFTPQDTIHTGDEKPKATIKRKFNKLHDSYAPAIKKDEKADKQTIYKLKLMDELKINPNYIRLAQKDSVQLIKITGFEYRKPFVIISAINAEEEHTRLTDTRQLDEASEFYYLFQIGYTVEGKEHPDMTRLRKWIWNKVDHSQPNTSLASMLRQLVDKVIFITEDDNPGYATYDFSDKISDFDRTNCSYEGSYCNVRISNRNIEEQKGEISFRKTSNSIEVYTGERLLRSYHIVGTDE